jgi:hypothetical protein
MGRRDPKGIDPLELTALKTNIDAAGHAISQVQLMIDYLVDDQFSAPARARPGPSAAHTWGRQAR